MLRRVEHEVHSLERSSIRRSQGFVIATRFPQGPSRSRCVDAVIFNNGQYGKGRLPYIDRNRLSCCITVRAFFACQ